MSETHPCHECGQPATIRLKDGTWACNPHGIPHHLRHLYPPDYPAEEFLCNRDDKPYELTAEEALRLAGANMRIEGFDVTEKHIAMARELLREHLRQRNASPEPTNEADPKSPNLGA